MRRVVVCSLPVLAAAAVLAVVIGSENGPPAHRRVAAQAPRERESARVGTNAAQAEPGAAHPGRELRGSAARHMPIPILMYHVIGTPRASTPNQGLWVTPALFDSQMQALHSAGYSAITLDQAWRGWTTGAPLPRKPVVVSFDDGYPGDYTHALPELRRLGWAGVLNLELDNVGPGNLSTREVRGLIGAGWEIDSHTIDHPDLTTVGSARLDYELRGSRRLLRERFRINALFFCYPYGRFDARVQAAVRAAGYRAATTEIEGYATPADPFALRRVRVQGGETGGALLARLRDEHPA